MNKKLLREYVRIILNEIYAIDNVHTSITEASDTDGDGRSDADELNLISKNMKDDKGVDAILGPEDDLQVDLDSDQLQDEELPIAVNNAKEKKLFKRIFLDNYSNVFKTMSPPPKSKGDRELRFGLKDPTVPVSAEQQKDYISQLGYNVVEEIFPKQPGSKSDKVNTLVVSRLDPDSGQPLPSFFIVFKVGRNKGEEHEDNVYDQIINGGPLGDELLNAIDVARESIVSVEERKPPRKRPLTGIITNHGAEISDITLNVKSSSADSPSGEEKVYISLKDPNGGTFANNGYSNSYELDNETGLVKPVKHDLDIFTDALGIDKNRFAQGLGDYIRHTKYNNLDDDDKALTDPPAASSEEHCKSTLTDDENPIGGSQKEIIMNYIGSGMGYGYVYARKNKSKPGYHVEYINTPDDVKALVGSPVSIQISYPRYCEGIAHPVSKQASVKVVMDNGAEYHVSLKNSSAGHLPNKCQIGIKKYPTMSIKESKMMTRLRVLIRESLEKNSKRSERYCSDIA
jgi:hypothetical protein